MSLTQTVTQMRIGAESTGQFLPGAFRIYESLFSDSRLCGHESADFSRCIGLHIPCGVTVSVQREASGVVTQHT